jgi:hypothetical protein
MRITWRDGVDTAFAAVVVAVMVAVVRGWDAPLLGTERAAIGVLLAIGFVMCQVGMRGSVTSGRDLVRGPFMVAGTALGAIALVLFAVGLVAPSQGLLLAVGSTLLALWAIATVHHAAAART